jgi:hypothetical protein
MIIVTITKFNHYNVPNSTSLKMLKNLEVNLNIIVKYVYKTINISKLFPNNVISSVKGYKN